jgi:hypothetical protein
MRGFGGRRLVEMPVYCVWLFSTMLTAENLLVIGGTPIQQQLSACIEHVVAGDLDRLSGKDHSMTIVIVEHAKFLQVKSSFGADRTRLAFSNLAIRRMYLSSKVFQDLDSVFRCIPHELGHFVTHSPYEDNAELAAEGIRKRAREVCTVPFE